MSETAVLEHAPRLPRALSSEKAKQPDTTLKRFKTAVANARAEYVRTVGTLDLRKQHASNPAFVRYEGALNDYLTYLNATQGLEAAERARVGEIAFAGAVDRAKHKKKFYGTATVVGGTLAFTAPIQTAIGVGAGLLLNKLAYTPVGRAVSDAFTWGESKAKIELRKEEAREAARQGVDYKTLTGSENLLGDLSKRFKPLTHKMLRDRYMRLGASLATAGGFFLATDAGISQNIIHTEFGNKSIAQVLQDNGMGWLVHNSIGGTAHAQTANGPWQSGNGGSWNGGGQPNGPFIQNGQPNGPWQPGPQTSHWPTQHVPQPRPYMPSPQYRPMPMPQRGGMNPVEGAFIGEGLRILDGALNHGQHGMYPGYEGGYGHSGMPTPPPGEGWHLESRTWDGHGWRNHWVRAEHHVVITHHEEIRHEATQAAAPAPHKEVCVPNAETADTYIPIHALGHAPWAANIGEMLQDNRIEDAANAFVNSHDLPAEAKPYLIDALQKLKTEYQHDSNPSHFFSDKIEDGQKFLAMLWKSKADHTAHILGAGKNIGGSFALGHDVTGKMFAFDYPDAQGVMHHDSGFIPMDCRNITLLSDTTVCPPENVAAVAGSAVSGEHVRPTLEQEIARLGGIQKVDHMLDDLGNPDANQFLDGKPGHYLAEHYPALPADEKAIVHPLQEAIHIDQPRLIATERAMHSAAELSAHHPTVKEMLTDTLK